MHAQHARACKHTRTNTTHRQGTHTDSQHTHTRTRTHTHTYLRARAHTHTHTHIQGTVSHKKMAVDTNWLLKIYYHNQLVLFLCCLLNETFFVM